MLQLSTEPLAPFKHSSGLICARWADGPEHDQRVSWVGSNADGCIVFAALQVPETLGGLSIKIAGQYWLPADVGRHSSKPVRPWDTKPTMDNCMYLDGVPCYYDGSSLQAESLLTRVVEAGSEDAIWDELADFHRSWIAPAIVATG